MPPIDFGEPIGLKLAHHHPGTISNANLINRQINGADEDDFPYILKKYIPEANGSVLGFKTCLNTYTKDENFIVDQLEQYDKKVIIACGFSGHVFKFFSVVGEILADLSMTY